MFVLGLGFVISVLLGWAAHASVDRNRISFFEKILSLFLFSSTSLYFLCATFVPNMLLRMDVRM